jgi:signal transduction histidine kinase
MRKLPVIRDLSRFGTRRLFANRWLPVVLVFSALSGLASAREPTAEKNVLFLESFSDHLDPVEPLKSELRARVPWSVNFYVEVLEFRLPEVKEYEKRVFEALRDTYSGKKLDLVMTRGYPALDFALSHRDELFPGVPIVFFVVDVTRLAGLKKWSGVTGVTVAADIGGTLDLAQHLHPDTNAVAVIAGNSEFDRYWLAAIHAELLRRQSKMTAIALVGLSPGQILERVGALPPRTVVINLESPQASVQPVMGTNDVLAWVGQRQPTYCIFPEVCLNHGGLGGSGYVIDRQSPLAAEVASRVLSGERPESIPVVNDTTRQVRLDWRQLRHWNIPESALPPGSVVLFREPDLWQKYRRYFILAATVLAVQSLLILALVLGAQRRQRLVRQLKDLGRRLIDAQEEDRRRIARELHDDLNQRMVLLLSHLEALGPSANGQSSLAVDLSREAREISTGISQLSHQLHSSALEILGLEAALQGLTRDLSLAYGLNIAFSSDGELSPMSAEVNLCLFRVAQESLSNALKHSGAASIAVRLCRGENANAIRLMVIDDGTGFDPQQVRTDSLGLISMRERLRLVDGELLINSSPNRGTEVIAHVRFNEHRSLAARA